MLPPIYPTLSAWPAVSAIVGTRIYPHADAPQDVTAPYVTWFMAGGAPVNTLSDPPLVDQMTVQIDCWHNTSAGVIALAESVRDAIEPHAHITGYPINARDAETQLYRFGLQLDWWLYR